VAVAYSKCSGLQQVSHNNSEHAVPAGGRHNRTTWADCLTDSSLAEHNMQEIHAQHGRGSLAQLWRESVWHANSASCRRSTAAGISTEPSVTAAHIQQTNRLQHNKTCLRAG